MSPDPARTLDPRGLGCCLLLWLASAGIVGLLGWAIVRIVIYLLGGGTQG